MKNRILDKYRKNRVEKLDAVPTGVSIERRHKRFIDENNLNLSAITRDAIDVIMVQTDTREEGRENGKRKEK